MNKKINKRKGFTLIELLAVIVVIAIILAIAIPAISSLIESSTKNTFESDAKLIIKGMDHKKLEDPSFDETTITESNITDIIGIPTDNIDTVSVTLVDGVKTITIKGKDKWAGLYACGTFMNMQVVTSVDDCSDGGEVVLGPVNQPILATGMTPVKWVNDVETSTTADDIDWYDYANQKWANAKTADGSYWVWIPRYAYSITSGYQSSTAGTIEIKFLNDVTNNARVDGISVATTPTYEGNSQTNYVLHPAFNFGGTQVTGIWIAKFEASNNGSGKVKVAPNVTSWRNVTVKTMYDNSRSMETDTIYGWDNSGNGIDTHMMKNIEWGAVAYLAKSTYGINDEIWINPANNYTTGCAGNSVSSATTTGCLNAYNTVSGINASTTRNITGIYDMSGGSWEYVMGNLDNLAASSGLTPSSIPNKYIDRYISTTNYSYNDSYFGDAYFETSYNAYVKNTSGLTNGSWYGDYSYAPYSTSPWFVRGGLYNNGAGAGAFYFGRFTGEAYSYRGFRPALLVASGL